MTPATLGSISDSPDGCAPVRRPLQLSAGRRHRVWIRATIGISMLLAVGCYALRALDLNLIEYGEGPILAMVARMQRQPMIPDWQVHPPLTLSCYGPAYYGVVALVDRFQPAGPSLVGGRIVNLLAALGTAALIYLTVLRLTASGTRAATGALFFLVSPIAEYWLPAYRVDMLAVFLSCAAFMAIAGRASPRRLVVCALLVAVGSLFKQVAALAALPIWVWLLVNRRWRQAAAFAGLVAAFGVAAWGVADLATDGSILGPAIKSNLNRMRLENGMALLRTFVWTPFSILCLAAAAWRLTFRAKEWEQPISLYALGLVTSVAINAVLCCKEGAALNYFLEASMLGSIVLALTVVPASEDLSKRWVGPVWVGLGLSVAAPVLVLLVFSRGSFHTRNADSSVVRAALTDGKNTTVLADSEWVDAVIRNGALPAVNDSFLLFLGDNQGSPAAQQLVDEMCGGRIEYMVLANPRNFYRDRDPSRWPASVVTAMERYYDPVANDQHAFVYRHRSAVAQRRSDDRPATK